MAIFGRRSTEGTRGGSDDWRQFVRGKPEEAGHGLSAGSGHSLSDARSSWFPSSYTGLTETPTSWASATPDILLAPDPPATADVPAPPWGSALRSHFLSRAAEHAAAEERKRQLLRGEISVEQLDALAQPPSDPVEAAGS